MDNIKIKRIEDRLLYNADHPNTEMIVFEREVDAIASNMNRIEDLELVVANLLKRINELEKKVEK